MTEILDEKFKYNNNLSFYNEEEFVDHYGNILYEKTISIFKEKWYQLLGDVIINGSPCFKQCSKEAYVQNLLETLENFHCGR